MTFLQLKNEIILQSQKSQNQFINIISHAQTIDGENL